MTTTTTRPTSPIATIEIIGSYAARHIESGTTVDTSPPKATRRVPKRTTTRSPIPVLCRKLIAQGIDPETRAHVVRKALERDGFTPIFNRDRPLAVWAGLDAIETETESVRIVKHRPFPSALVTKEAKAGAATPSDTRETQRPSEVTTAQPEIAMGEAA
ncbi:hypothetical protein [Agrobacterium sp. MA01]|uniref:hypothetical protein n=1 Tax=Agrobacterium sp. MA01 TaxID=2664893 RepID=UPI001890E2BD|nr:hypothetical protein [Agrobacterium sp. MA01]